MKPERQRLTGKTLGLYEEWRQSYLWF